MAPGVNPIFPEADAFAVEVATPGGRTLPVGSPELRAELEERAGQALTLRFSERSLYDCRPVSLFGNATAEALGQELGMRIDRRRFRANFYADWSDGEPVSRERAGRPHAAGRGAAADHRAGAGPTLQDDHARPGHGAGGARACCAMS